jgi:hypothetical protein
MHVLAMKVWDATGSHVGTLTGHAQPVADAIAVGGRFPESLASVGSGGAVKLWNVRDLSFSGTVKLEGGDGARLLLLHDDQNTLLARGVAEEGASIDLISLPQLGRRAVLGGRRGALTAMAVYVNNTMRSSRTPNVAAGDAQGRINVYGLQGDGSRPWRTLSAEGAGAVAQLFGHAYQHLAAGYADGSIRIWSPDHERVEHTLSGHAGGVTGLMRQDAGLLSTGADGVLKLWDPKAGVLKASGNVGAAPGPLQGLAVQDTDGCSKHLRAVCQAGDRDVQVRFIAPAVPIESSQTLPWARRTEVRGPAFRQQV